MNQKEVIITVVGDKYFSDYEFFEEKMYEVLEEYFKEEYTIKIREQEVTSVDNFCVRFCKENNCILERYKILWDEYGKSAAYVNNKFLLNGKIINKSGSSKILVIFLSKYKDNLRMIEDLEEAFNSCVTYYNNPSEPEIYKFIK